MKLFISQPMSGKSDEEILKVRKEAVNKVYAKHGKYVEVIDSFFQGAPHEAKPLWFLGKSIQLLSTADIVYFAKGWQDYRGCKIEYECASQYGIEIMEE